MKLSVIVCTRNRAYAIKPCLDSIARSLARAAPIDAEIVVVDNGSSDDTPAIVRAWVQNCPFPVQALHEPRKGVATARNCALRAAKGDLLVWTDDDCRLSEDHIENALRHDAADSEPVLRGGRVELGDPADLPLSIKVGLTMTRWSHSMRSARHESLSNCIIGCNFVMRRTLVEKIGYFDERFGAGSAIPGGEDSDYVYRAYLAGVPIEYVPDIIVFHHHGRNDLIDGNKLLRNYMIGKGGLYAKYLFRHLDFSRPAWWTVKNALREILHGKTLDRSKPGFSFQRIAAYNALGALKFYAVSGVKLWRRSQA
ncbi:MAG TPA: glycosyltransferase family A protein [Alphaproteobacteria bacterium]|nr:glycosyltransferase family A protein [Alphaproteobacteria bacterium]